MVVMMSLVGEIDPERCATLTRRMISACGLSVAPGATCCTYPAGGKGGVGFTYFQPITESFITWDVWPEIGGAYLVVFSCKPIWIAEIKKVLEAGNLKITNVNHQQLSLT